MDIFKMDLAFFGEDGAAAPAAVAGDAGSATADAGAAQPAGAAAPQAQMPANVSPRVAAELQRQMKAHPENFAQKGPAAGNPQAQPKPQVDAQAAQAQQDADADLQARWESMKKGEFAKLFGQDVQAAIKDRFKNQKQDTAELEAYRKLEPALKVLRERAGVESNNDLANQILDDDSLYEDAANDAGMTVAAYKNYLKFKQEHDDHVRQAEEQQQQEAVRQHYMELTRQAEELKKQFPDFDLQKELKNERFMKMTSPQVRTPVAEAYFAVHYAELAPKMMSYGMQRAKQQMAQDIMAKGARPREGGLNTQNTAADMSRNFAAMDRKEREKIYARIHSRQG